MITVFAILRRWALWDTLPAFSQIPQRKDPMARQHIVLPDNLIAQVNEVCYQLSMTKSKFLVRAVQMAVDDARKRFAEPANDPVATQVATPPPPPAAAPPDSPWPCIQRGDSVWFELKPVCAALGLEPENIKGEIDPDDDVLDYIGKEWIDRTGLAAARELSRVDAPDFWKFVEARMA